MGRDKFGSLRFTIVRHYIQKQIFLKVSSVYSTGNNVQYLVITFNEKNYENKYMYVYA